MAQKRIEVREKRTPSSPIGPNHVWPKKKRGEEKKRNKRGIGLFISTIGPTQALGIGGLTCGKARTHAVHGCGKRVTKKT